jgi:hypothetical protein
LAAGLVLVGIGGLLSLYGLLLILYRDHGGSNTYVTLFGHQRNAHLVGAATLLMAPS